MSVYSISVTPQETSERWPTMWIDSSRWVWQVTADNGDMLTGARGPAWTRTIGIVKARHCRMSLVAEDRRKERSKRRVAKHAAGLAQMTKGL